MVRKTSSIILALAIVTSGYFAWKKLNYWDRSVMIFKYNPAEQQFKRGMDRGFGRFPEGGMRRGGEFHGNRTVTGSKINLRTVPWYLAIFASFAVVVIYIEKGIKFIGKKKTDVPFPFQKQQQDCGID